MTRSPRETALDAVPFAIAIAYAAIVMQHGVPALRQDWAWPTNVIAFDSSFVTSTSGWDPRGIGSPNLHLNDYIVGGMLALAGRLFGSAAALCMLLLGVGLSSALGAASLARAIGAPRIAGAAAALFSVFNPWAYTETVAGHTYMLLAFGGLIALCAELVRETPRPLAASLLVALTLVQLQFFLIAVALAAVFALSGRARLPLASGIVVALAPLFAIIADYGAYRGVPITLAWERSQSTPMFAALNLGGYFAGYGQHVDPFDRWAMAAVIALSVTGLIAAWKRRLARLALVALVVSVLASAGLDGYLAAPVAWAFAHVPAAGLYRELFDILGIAVIAYVAGAAFAAARWRLAGAAFAASGLALAAAWFVWSPWSWWVSAASIPAIAPPESNAYRFALMPAFQPLTFESQGSGLDPDAYIRGADAPLNVQAPQYPVDAALARFELSGDAGALAALGVSVVIDRPWLRSDERSRAFQVAIPLGARGHTTSAASPGASERVISIANPQPLVALLPSPVVASVADELGAGAVLFSDAANVRGLGVPPTWATFRPLIPVSAIGSYVDAAAGWVDARLAFQSVPRISQALGGAATTSSRELLHVSAGIPALAFVEGRLLAQDGSLITGTTRGYRWIALSALTNAVRCLGLCAIAAQGYPPADARPNPRAARAIALAANVRTPWLIQAATPSGPSAMLRLNDAFDRGWLAVEKGASLPHVRVDAAVNGWFLPQRSTTETITLVHWPAAVEALLELCGVAWLLALAGVAIRGRRV